MKNGAAYSFSRKLASMLFACLLLLVTLTTISTTFAASAPNIFSYQGRLLNANGVPVSDASKSMIFELYTASSGGSCVWSNSSATCASATARTVTLTDGLFSENLGDTAAGVPYAAITDSIFGDNAALYLQVTVGGEALTPRKQILSAPYALNSDTLDGLNADNDGSTAAAIPALNSNGALVITGNPTGSTVGLGSLYVNPAAADVSAGDAIFGVAVEGNELFRLFNEGASLCNSALCDTITIGTNADADAITIGDDTDATALNGASLTFISDDLTTITAGTGLVLNSNAGIAFNPSSTLITTLSSSGYFSIDAVTTNTATIPFQLMVDADPASGGDVRGMFVGYEALDDANANQTFGAIGISLQSSTTDAADNVYGLSIANSEGAGVTDAMVYLRNADSDAASVTDGIRFDVTTASGMTDAIDASDADIDNALNVGANIITGLTAAIDFTNFDVAAGGDVTITKATPRIFLNDTGVADFSLSTSLGTFYISNDTSATDELIISALGTIYLGDVAAARTIDIGGVTENNASTINIATESTTGDFITIGNANLDTTLALLSSNWSISTGGVMTFAAANAQTSAIVVDSGGQYTNGLDVGDTNIIGTNAAINLSNFDVSTAGAITVAAGEGLDTNGAGVLALGNANATSLSLCNSAACDTISIGTNGDSDAIIIGDNLSADTLSFTSAQSTGTDVTFDIREATTATGVLVERAESASNDYDGNLLRLVINETSATSDGTVLSILNRAAGNSQGIYITQDTVADATTAPTSQALVIDINEAANNDEVILIRSDADGGGVDTEFRFENDGDAFADGAFTGTGADFAEFFYSIDPALTNSYVACRDTGTPNGVKRCEANNTNVVGVVSPNPGFIGNNIPGAGGDLSLNPNYRTIGLIGQIETYVSADDGAIAIGDPLTTSSTTAGYAGKMRGSSQIIGFALEPMAAGVGTIKVLVQPQWYGSESLAGSVAGLDVDGALSLLSLADATFASPVVDSNALTFIGSAWNGASASDVGMGLRAKISDLSNSRLAIESGAGTEVASFTNTGDLTLSGKFYPSDRGASQSSAYIYYDSSAGPGYMKTNAAGWSVGSYDFAETFPSTETLKAGEVVVFGSNPESVVRSTGGAYDDRIAGVVSTRPGFLAGEYKAGTYPIALSGRVPTLVSAENGTIEIGDPLTTSSRPGYAMKATEAGPIVGYAMERLAEGEGKKIVFVRASYYDGNGKNVAPAVNNSVSQLSSSFSALNVTDTLNMNGGNILAVGTIEGSGGNWKIAGNGDFTTRGRLVQKVQTADGELVDTFAAASREMTVQLSGTTTLTNGRASVAFEEIDAKFNDIISLSAPYRVIVTPSGITGQLYVTDRTNQGFTIHDSGSSSGVAVDWLVIAYHKDYAPTVTVTTIPEIIIPTPAVVVDDTGMTDEITPDPQVAGETIEETLPEAPLGDETPSDSPLSGGEGAPDASPVDEPLPTTPEFEILPPAIEVESTEVAPTE